MVQKIQNNDLTMRLTHQRVATCKFIDFFQSCASLSKKACAIYHISQYMDIILETWSNRGSVHNDIPWKLMKVLKIDASVNLYGTVPYV